MPPRVVSQWAANQRDGVVPGFAGVDHDRLLRLGRLLHLLDEDVVLDFSRREVVVIVEADFTDRDDFGMLCEISEVAERILVRFRGVVRVDSDGRVERFVAIGKADAGFQIGRAVACADRHKSRHARFEGAPDHFFAVRIELVAIQVTVRVD